MAVQQDDGPNRAPALAARYATAFAAYLSDRGEHGLGAAYDLGREAVAAHLSVLDVAEAHHAALRGVLAGDEPAVSTLQAAEDFLRESLSIFESVHRGYTEVQEVARLEHAHVEQLRALADASMAINSSPTVEEILQLAADTARGIIRGQRASVAIMGSNARLPPLSATSPRRLGDGPHDPARLSARLTDRGSEIGAIDVVDQPGREYTARERALLD
ncbi:MAG: phosphatase RsbU N-terminal domain-containing protein, partial [Solirubrobacteraceae bacterium]